MPFGIPPPQGDMFGELSNGIDANISDLSSLFNVANQQLVAGSQANAGDLASFGNKLVKPLNRGIAANTTNLNTVAQALTLSLAAGAQANAADLATADTLSALGESAQGNLPPAGWYAAITWNIAHNCYVAEVNQYYACPGGPNTSPTCQGFTVAQTYPTALAINYFPTQAQAQQWANQWIQQHGGLCPGQPPPPLPPPPIQPPPVVYDVFCDANEHIHVLPANTLPAIPPGWTLIVTTSDPAVIAQVHCAPIGVPGPTPPPTPPPPTPPPVCVPPPTPPPPPPPLPEQCFQPDQCIQIGMGYPGTVEFCRCMGMLKQSLSEQYGNLVGWAQQTITTDAILGFLNSWQNQGSPLNIGGYVLDGFVAMLKVVVTAGKPYIDRALQTIVCTLQLVTSINSAGDTELMVILLVFKWLLNAVKEWQLGTDAALWLIDKIELSFGPFEELLDRLIQWAFPVQIPGPPEATRGWLMGQVSTDIRDCIWQLHGLNPQMYLPFAMAEAETLTADEAIRFGMRNDFDYATISRWLTERGWQRGADRDAKLSLFWELPTIQDHLHWLSRNVDDSSYVKTYGLLDGFSTDAFINQTFPTLQYQTLTNTHGRDFWATYGHDLTSQGLKPEYAAYHYAAHWIQPSPEQMREFVYRLRPNNPSGLPPFTPADFDRILSEQDYAPLARSWFGATLYRVPALTYIIGMYRANVISEADLASYHQDLGFTATDSDRFVGVDQLQKRQIRTRQYDGWTPAAIGQAYSLGQMTKADAQSKLADLGATPAESDDTLNAAAIKLNRSILVRARSRMLTRTISQVASGLAVGAIDQQDAIGMMQGLGFPLDKATAIAQAELAKGRISILQQGVTAIKRRLFGGWITLFDATGLLSVLGIVPEKIREYVALWSLQWTPVRKRRTASQVVNDLTNGMMDQTEALMRLGNLGYDNADQLLYLADAQRKITQRQAAALAAQARTDAQMARQQQQLANQAAKQARQLQAQARFRAPRGVLTKWLRKGTIAPPEFITRMIAQGYSLRDSTRYAADAITNATRSTLEKWYKRGLITRAMFSSAASSLGIPASEITLYLASVYTVPKTSDLQKWAKLGIITESELRDELQRTGYEPADIDRYAAQSFPPPPPTP